MSVGLIGMWCRHCNKASHDSSDCWSTHALPASEPPAHLSHIGGLALHFLRQQTRAEVQDKEAQE